MLASTLNVIHGRRTPLDLVEVTTRDQTLYSFLSIGWGLLADMDIQSERLRFMGGFRFTVYGLIRTIGKEHTLRPLADRGIVTTSTQEVPRTPQLPASDCCVQRFPGEASDAAATPSSWGSSSRRLDSCGQ